MADDTLRTHGNRAKYHQRVADAWAMRIRGADWATIARATGYSSPQNAMRAVRTYSGRLPVIETTDALRSLWRERLEYLWPLAVRDVQNARPGATRAAVAIADRASKLDGLDAPTRIDLSPDEAVLEELMSRLMHAAGIEPIIEADVLELEVIPDPATADDDGGEP